MRRSIIVTDLTRFHNPDIVCTAGADCASGECVRPMPYLKSARCRELKVFPGSILRGDFIPTRDREGPHQEDCKYRNLRVAGPCSPAEFKTALEYGLYESAEAGFEVSLAGGQKCIPPDHPVMRSLITIAVEPRNVEVIVDSRQAVKLKLNFTDRSGREFRFISITDLRFHRFAVEHHARDDLNRLNRWIHAHHEVLLRLGLSRRYTAPDGRDGYWLQANGIYTFPDVHRAYHR